MIKAAHVILAFCQGVFLISSIVYLVNLFVAIWKNVKYGDRVSVFDLNPFIVPRREQRVPRRILLVISLLGLVNLVNSFVFSSHQFGAFYEDSNYTETYEASLLVSDDSIYCLAKVRHESGREDGHDWSYYSVEEISLPFGRTLSSDDGLDLIFSPGAGSISFCSPGTEVDCSLSLGSPANDTSYALLDASVVSRSGPFCASVNSDVFHCTECYHVGSISPENLVYFNSASEALLFGFTYCSDCFVPAKG